MKYWNTPMITAGALAGDFGIAKNNMFSTLTRLGSNFNTLVRFFITVLEHYEWRRLNVIYHPFGQTDISRKFCHILANDIHYGFRYVYARVIDRYINYIQPYLNKPGPNFTIKDVPSVLILIIADQMLNDSLCCSSK